MLTLPVPLLDSVVHFVRAQGKEATGCFLLHADVDYLRHHRHLALNSPYTIRANRARSHVLNLRIYDLIRM